MNNIPTIDNFLACQTPKAWLEEAIHQESILLIDHANCEKKAAAAALHLMHRYVEHQELLQKMARLAREELLHFQKVVKLMTKRNIKYQQLSASRYAKVLHDYTAKQEPARLVDLLIIGAFIEARSCERFAALAPYLDTELQTFYLSLYKAEHRHFTDYLKLAQSFSKQPIAKRVAEFCELESELITSDDDQFRFHGGIPK